MTAEDRYILKRKIKAFGNTMLFLLCRIMPIQQNKIAVCTFEGKGGFGCNPKYIVEELHRRNPEYQFVWFVNDMTKEFPAYITKVKNTVWNRARHLSTAKIWIDNYRKPYGTVKRKEQYYFQTWHATVSIKSIGLWRGKAFSKMAYLVSKNDSDMIDYVITDSKWCDEMYPKGLVYNGKFLRIGAPRCDILYGDRTRQRIEVRKEYHLPEDAKIALFAPTFRESSHGGKREVSNEEWSLDYERLLKNLEKRFGGEWYLCIRLHPQIAEKLKSQIEGEAGKQIFDASLKDDMSELLAGMDACVTDYSSIAMDASFADMPVFLYADDLKEYIHTRGGMQWEFHEDSYEPITNNREMTPGITAVMPYPMAQDNEELERNILGFDEEEYGKRMEAFKTEIELVFDGKSSKRAAERIEQFLI